MMKYIILLTTLLITSCATFFNEGNTSAKNIVLKTDPNKKLVCDKREFYINSQPHTEKVVREIQNKYKLDARALMASAILIETYYSPHATSINSSYDMIIKKGKKTNYYRYDSLDGNNILALVENLLKKSKSKRSLRSIVKIIEENTPYRIHVTQEFSNFLKENQNNLSKEKTPTLYKGQQILYYGETYPRYPLKNVLTKKKRPAPKTYLFDYQTKNYSYKCNIDLNLYKNKIYISKDPTKSYRTHLAIRLNNEFITIQSSQNTNPSQNIKKVPVFLNTKKEAGLAFCIRDSKDLVISFGPVEAGQVLYKTILKLEKESSFGNIHMQGREVVLIPPKRRVAETKKLNKKTLNKFLQDKIPLYHVEEIGNVWFFNESVHLDPRGREFLTCN